LKNDFRFPRALDHNLTGDDEESVKASIILKVSINYQMIISGSFYRNTACDIYWMPGFIQEDCGKMELRPFVFMFSSCWPFIVVATGGCSKWFRQRLIMLKHPDFFK